MSRDERQELGISLFRKTGKGTLNWCTGMGKTRAGTIVMDRIIEKKPDANFVIVVPTNPLKDQWQSRVNPSHNCKIITIQSLLSKNEPLDCYLLIIDEIHKFAADKFSQIFDLVSYRFILGLTATFNRLDGKEELIEKFCPVVDIIPLELARKNGWVADFIEYNWGIDFSPEDLIKYNEINEQIEKNNAIFNHDYNVTRAARTNFGAAKFVEDYDPDIIIEGRRLQGSELTRHIATKANIILELYDKRKELLGNNNAKIDAVIEAVRYLNMKTVTFGLSINTADILTDKLGKRAVSWHSSIPTQYLNLPNKKGVIKPKKVGSKTLQKMILEDFDNNKYETMNTAQKADLGLDVKGLRAAIIYDSTRDPGVHDQRRGRVTRKEEILLNGEVLMKEAIILNIYMRNTKDVYVLKDRQKNSFRVRNINSLKEIKL